jgi:hypothetical protein
VPKTSTLDRLTKREWEKSEHLVLQAGKAYSADFCSFDLLVVENL